MEFTAKRAAGDPLWGRIAPVADDDAPLHGFVLTLEETARPLSSTELLPAVRVTAELLLRLLPQLEARGIATLAEAVRASRQYPLSRLKY